MISRSKISLNRMLFPVASLEEFFKLSTDMGLNKVELRNDLPGIGVCASNPHVNVIGCSGMAIEADCKTADQKVLNFV